MGHGREGTQWDRWEGSEGWTGGDPGRWIGGDLGNGWEGTCPPHTWSTRHGALQMAPTPASLARGVPSPSLKVTSPGVRGCALVVLSPRDGQHWLLQMLPGCRGAGLQGCGGHGPPVP